MRQVRSTEEGIVVEDGMYVLAKFEDSGTGMDGEITEGHAPRDRGGRQLRLSASDLIAVAQFLLEKAKERAEWEEMK